jgi:hypothetical protein
VSSTCTADPDGAGPAPPFAVSDSDDSLPGDFDLGRDVRALLGTPAADVLQVKASYRFGR